MDQPYSAWADWLNKFHTASEGIQALWIVAGAATVVGVTWVVTRGVVEVVRVWRVSRVLQLDENSFSDPAPLHQLPVMPGLDPGTHDFLPTRRKKDVGSRVKPGHDGGGRCRN